MLTDTEIWEQACERVGLWKRPIDDPAAVVAILKWLFTIGDIDNLSISVDYTVKDGHLAAPPWMVSMLNERGPRWLSTDQQWTLPLALAAAVCALPEEKP